jgi:hypothetical protein
VTVPRRRRQRPSHKFDQVQFQPRPNRKSTSSAASSNTTHPLISIINTIMADESKSVSFSVDGSQRAKSSMDISSRSAEGGGNGSGSGNGGDREPSRSSTMKRNSLRSSFFKMRSMSFRRYVYE